MAATKRRSAIATEARTLATPSATANIPRIHSRLFPLWSLLALLLLPLLACGFGATVEDDAAAHNANSGNVALRAQLDGESVWPPLYLADGAGLQPGTLKRITLDARDANGTVTATVITPQQTPRLQAVWAQRHLAFHSMLLAESGDYFRLNPGDVAPNSRLHVFCDQNRLELRALGTVAPIFTTTTRSGACGAIWSPDSTRFAFATPAGVTVYTVNEGTVNEGELTALPATAMGIPWAWSPAWSPGGAQLLVQVEDDLRIYARDGTYTTLSIRVANLQAAYWSPAESPRGARIFLLDGRGAPVDTNAGRNAGRIGAVLAYDLERGTLDTLLEADRLHGTLDIAPAPDGSAVAAWHVDCRRVLSEFVPILVLECEAELRLLEIADDIGDNGGDNGAISVHTLLPGPTDAPLVARRQAVPQMVWADWRMPVDAASLEPPAEGSISDAPPVLPALDLDVTPGTSPWVPVALGETATASDYRYRVHEVLRGDAASVLVYDGVITSDVAIPAPGYEHLAARLEIEHMAGATVELGQVFFPRLYSSNWVGTSHLYLIDATTGLARRTFTADDSLEIWVTALIARDESAPVLRLSHVSNLRAPFYMALSAVGGLPSTPVLTPQASNSVGLTEPASPGTPVITRDWQIEVLSLDRRTSDDGVTFAARLRIGYQGAEPEFCGEVAFAGLAAVNLYTPGQDSVLNTPRLGLSCFLPGGVFETLLVFTAPSDVTAPTFYFHVPDTDSGPLRYFTLISEDVAPTAAHGADAPQLPAVTQGPPPLRDAPPAPRAAIESSRAQPLPMDATVEHEFIRYTVAQTVRGAAALRQVRSATSINQTLLPGMEYVLVELVVENLAESQAPVPAYEIGLTGGAGVLYRRQFVAGSGPSVPTQLAPKEQARGWMGYVVAADDPGLVLVIPAPFDADFRASRFLALTPDAGAATLAAQATLPDPVVPNTVGESLDAPAARDAPIITTRWQLEIVDTRRGDAAWEMVQTANPNNEPPPPGYEYVLARVRLRLLAAPQTAAVNVTGVFLLDVVNVDGTSTPSQVTVAPQPRLDATLFAGGQVEGWFVDLAPVDTPVFLEFEDHSSEDGPRYVALP